MKLGILVNTDRHLDEIKAIADATLVKGHEVSIFIIDRGAFLMGSPQFAELAGGRKVKMRFCDYSALSVGAETDNLPEGIICSSQLDNAIMNHECDKVIVL